MINVQLQWRGGQGSAPWKDKCNTAPSWASPRMTGVMKNDQYAAKKVWKYFRWRTKKNTQWLSGASWCHAAPDESWTSTANHVSTVEATLAVDRSPRGPLLVCAGGGASVLFRACSLTLVVISFSIFQRLKNLSQKSQTFQAHCLNTGIFFFGFPFTHTHTTHTEVSKAFTFCT